MEPPVPEITERRRKPRRLRTDMDPTPADSASTFPVSRPLPTMHGAYSYPLQHTLPPLRRTRFDFTSPAFQAPRHGYEDELKQLESGLAPRLYDPPKPQKKR